MTTTAIEGYVVEHNFPGIGTQRLVLNSRRIVSTLGNSPLILLAMVNLERSLTDWNQHELL